MKLKIDNFKSLLVLAGKLTFSILILLFNFKPAVSQTSKFEPRSNESSKTKIVEKAANEANADFAFSAFQRGYYLTALELALPRAQLGDPAAQTLIAELYANGLGVKLDHAQALSWYRLAAQAGDINAQFAYAMYLLDGVNVEKDEAAAKVFLEKSAKGGNSTAQFNLAQLEIANRPTRATYAKALKLFKSAAENGNADAQYAVAQILSQGLDGLGQRPADAFTWLERAAQARIVGAQIELGIWLANGTGTEADPNAAFRWMSQAASTGNPLAQNRLAQMYANGVGTEIDQLKAAQWHILARRGGLSDANLDRMFNRMNMEMRAEALSLANLWPRTPIRDPFSSKPPQETAVPQPNRK